jgi:hypothetical protein
VKQPGSIPAQPRLVDAEHQRAPPQPLAHQRLEVAGTVQLLRERAAPIGLGISAQFVAGATGDYGVKCLKAASGDRPRAVGDAFAAFEEA